MDGVEALNISGSGTAPVRCKAVWGREHQILPRRYRRATGQLADFGDAQSAIIDPNLVNLTTEVVGSPTNLH